MSLYREDDVGRYKVEALREIVLFLTGVELKVHSEHYRTQVLKRCSVIASVDDMDNGRIPLWKSIRLSPSIDLLVDTRVHEGYGEIYSIVPFSNDDGADYDKTLFSNKEAAMRVCGTHGVAFVSTSLASSAVASLCHFWQTGEYNWQRAFRYDTLEQVL
jgi:hypothetical protein